MACAQGKKNHEPVRAGWSFPLIRSMPDPLCTASSIRLSTVERVSLSPALN